MLKLLDAGYDVEVTPQHTGSAPAKEESSKVKKNRPYVGPLFCGLPKTTQLTSPCKESAMTENFNSNDLRAQLAKITRNYIISDDDESEAVQVQEAKGFVESVLVLPKNGASVKIHEDPGHRLHYGATIWRCCRFLCNYFDERPVGFFKDKRVLELGSGTALAAIAIASLGAKVTATDTSMALPLIKHNLSLNPNVVNNVNIAELEWYDAPKYIAEFSPPFDYLIASDVIYNSTAHRALANVISLLADNHTTVFVAYQERGLPGSQENFFSIMKEKGFGEIQRLTTTEDGGEDGTLVLHVVLLSKSPN